MDVEPAEVIISLLEQNSKLRLELATLVALKKKTDEIEAQMQNNQNIPPEAQELLSKFDIR